MKIDGVYYPGCNNFKGGIAIVGEKGSELIINDLSIEQKAATKYPIKESDCWQRKRRQEYLRDLYIQRLRNESK